MFITTNIGCINMDYVTRVTPPSANGRQQFFIEFHMSDGAIMSIEFDTHAQACQAYDKMVEVLETGP